MPSPERTDARDARPWYREPMVWMILVLPLLAVAGSVTSAYLAARGADPEVADEIRRDGLAIRVDPTRDRAAAAIGAKAVIDAQDGVISARLQLAPGTPAPSRLVMVLSHATRAELDRMLTLDPGGDGTYRSRLGPINPGHWYVEIAPGDRSWRLTGEFSNVPDHLALSPRPVS